MPRGGAGAGRKPKPLTVLKKARAEEVLASIDEVAFWKKLLQDDDPRIRLQAGIYLTDRRDGKAAATVNLKPINHP